MELEGKVKALLEGLDVVDPQVKILKHYGLENPGPGSVALLRNNG